MQRTIPYLSISDVVDEFFGSFIGSNRKYYENYLINAKWVWKKIYRESVREILHRYVPIDKTTSPHSIVIPKDLILFLGASLTNSHGDHVPMHRNDSMVILPKPDENSSGCGCMQCTCNSSGCGAVEQFSIRSREVQIAGTTYIETIWNKKCANGDVLEIRKTPIQDYYSQTEWTLKYVEQQRIICSLDVKPCGCLIASSENSAKLSILQSFTSSCRPDTMDLFIGCNSKTGEFKVGSDGRAYLRGYNPEATHVIISGQTNGECPMEEIMIPETCVDAMHLGMIWRSKAMSGQRLDIREAYRQFKAALTDYEEFMQPVSIDEFLEVQGVFHKWGSVLNTPGRPGPLCIDRCLTRQQVTTLASASTPSNSSGGSTVTPPVVDVPVDPPPVPSSHSQYTDQYSSQYN